MWATPPVPSAQIPGASIRPPSAGSAETLVLVGLVLQVLGAALVFGLLAWFFGFSVFHPFRYFGFAVAAAAVVGAIVVVFLYFAYTFSYDRIRRGDYQGARTPTLLIGILSLFFGVVPGILYLIGYVKLEDAIREQFGWPAGPTFPAPPGYVGLVACRSCGRVTAAGPQYGAFCPACGQKLAA